MFLRKADDCKTRHTDWKIVWGFVLESYLKKPITVEYCAVISLLFTIDCLWAEAKQLEHFLLNFEARNSNATLQKTNFYVTYCLVLQCRYFPVLLAVYFLFALYYRNAWTKSVRCIRTPHFTMDADFSVFQWVLSFSLPIWQHKGFVCMPDFIYINWNLFISIFFYK
jgi:hypothetical protein